MTWREAPLVGVPTGAVNGIDVLDIDGDAGRNWYDMNFDAIPATRAHSTRRGMHLLFVHAPDLRCSTGKIAPGVDVRANGGYVIWWPREGYPVEDAPISEWPDWLLEEARAKPRSHEYPSP
jgi:Bifunctional DNA primase/polymerase, N-terminal